jgi:hypothetical protein
MDGCAAIVVDVGIAVIANAACVFHRASPKTAHAPGRSLVRACFGVPFSFFAGIGPSKMLAKEPLELLRWNRSADRKFLSLIFGHYLTLHSETAIGSPSLSCFSGLRDFTHG